MINVLKVKGKGKGSYGYNITFMQFEDSEKAEEYIKEHTDLESKYWTAFQYLHNGVEDEIYFNE